jgi:hypothetical protein
VESALPLALAAALFCATATSAQTAVRVRVDNDAFNFWQAPADRPDEEYTSGVMLSADFSGAPFWARWLDRDAAACTPLATRCVSRRWTLGQSIYTGATPLLNATRFAGSRPNAGVLWLSEVASVARTDRLDEVGLTVGITGEPSLAETFQRIAHSTAQYVHAEDWADQIPAEPVFDVTYDQRRLVHLGALELQPHGGASLGNLLTEARAGLTARAGWNLLPPFFAAAMTKNIEVAFTADATERLVGWNETLSGTLFRDSRRATLRPLVTELQGGLSVRIERATVTYSVQQTGAEYTTRTSAHVWSTLQVEWYLGR